MEIELVEIRDFIAQYHPFDLLPIELLNSLTENLQIRYVRRGQCFPPENETTQFMYIIRSGAVELRDMENMLIGKLAEGDSYTSACQLVDINQSSCHTTLEDCLVYQLPCSYLKQLSKQSPELKHFFEADLRQRLKRAAKYGSEDVDFSIVSMTTPVSELIKKPPVTLSSMASVRTAAEIMSQHNVSSIILTEDEQFCGILTDRDIRQRCVANGLGADTPVNEIMSPDVYTIDSNELVLNALMLMTKQHFNHLPIVENNKVIGMLTATDMTRHSSSNPAFITSQIYKSQSVDELQKNLSRLPELQLSLANADISARHIGETISSITDALTIRLIELAQLELGPAPVPFVWMAGGSQARLEQSSHSDQDNALLLADEVDESGIVYFQQLAQRVCDGLNSCGFVYCPGNAMASNPQWCQPLAVWKRYFKQWIEKSEPMALMLSSIFFDLRPVSGDFSLHKKMNRNILKMTQENSLFIAHMTANALKLKPPVGFFRTFVLIHDGEHDNTFDIKHRGIVPITDVARVLALAEGIHKVNTTERLKALGKTRSMSREMSKNLIDALEFIANLRIRHQAGQIRRNMPADNFLPPDNLSPLERKHLKAAFEIIKEAQDALERRYKLP